MAVQGTYGRGQMLGATVDPRLFMQDYSGFAKAGAIQGQALSDLGGQIGGAITQFADIKKQNAAMTGQIKGIDKQIDSAMNLFPEMAGQLESFKVDINDPNRSLTERAAIAASYGDLINNSLNMMKTSTSLDIARQRESRMAAKAAGGGGGGATQSRGNINPFTGQPY